MKKRLRARPKGFQMAAFGQISGQLDDVFQTPSEFLENGLKIRVDLVRLHLDIAFPNQVAARIQGDLTGDVEGVAGLCHVRGNPPPQSSGHSPVV